MAMRDVIFDAINKGGATRESLLELTGTTEKGLASQFTYLRMMGKCPKKQEDGTYKIVSAEEWNSRSSAGASSVPLTPEQRLEKMEKRSKRASTAYDNAKKRAEIEINSENELIQLKFVKAETEFKIAEIELGQAQVIVNEQPEKGKVPKQPEVPEEDTPDVPKDEDNRAEDEELDFDNDEFEEGLG